MIPTRSGPLQLPALEVVWWNTVEDRLERTTLEARTLDVADNPNLAPPAAEPPVLSAVPAEQAVLWPWQLSTALLALSTLIGFGLWLHARRQPAVQRAATRPYSAQPARRSAPRLPCQRYTGHPPALDAWARQQPETLADMAARFVPLSDALDGLNGALYSEAGQRWQGDALWQAIQGAATGQQPGSRPEQGALPPLYPR